MTVRSGEESGQAFTGRLDEATKRILPDDWVTHLHLLRHGEVEQHTKRVVRGQLDVALSAEGERQTAELCAWFAACEPRPTRLVTSDLVRCRLLGERLAALLGLELEVTLALREQDLGAWQGRTWADVTAEDGPAVTAYWDDYVNARPTGGESYGDLYERIGAWWAERAPTWRGENVVLVTHIGPIRALLCRLLGVPPAQALRFAPAVGSHSALGLSEAGAVVHALGERPWLRPETVPRSARARGKRALRLATCGSAGTGKTTLAKRLAQELGLVYVEEGMRRRLEQGFDIHDLDPAGHRALMREMLAEQRAAETQANEGSIADRSPLDFAAFWLHYGLYEDEAETERFTAEMAEESREYDAVLLLPHGVLPLESDGVRSTNAFVQLRYQALVEGMLERYLPPEKLIRVPSTLDFEERVRFCLAALAP